MNKDEIIGMLKMYRYKGIFFRPKSPLVMDSMKTYVKDSVMNTFKAVLAKTAIIPGRLIKKSYPLDIGINISFNSKIRILQEKQMTHEEKHNLRKVVRFMYVEICEQI